jgi:hypothetical protein
MKTMRCYETSGTTRPATLQKIWVFTHLRVVVAYKNLRLIFVSICNSRRCNFLSTKWKRLGRSVKALHFFFYASDISIWPLSWPHVSALIIFTAPHVSVKRTLVRTLVLPNTVAVVPDCSFYWRHSVESRSSLTSMFGLSTFVIAFFYTNASTFRDWFLRTGMRPRGQWVGLPHSLAIAQISQLSEVLYFRNLCWLLSCFMEWEAFSMV